VGSSASGEWCFRLRSLCACGLEDLRPSSEALERGRLLLWSAPSASSCRRRFVLDLNLNFEARAASYSPDFVSGAISGEAEAMQTLQRVEGRSVLSHVLVDS
jgi:hypothetical protein